jgi:hypothetical protein
MTTETIAIAILLILTVILTFYNHRQAASIRAIESVAQDYLAIQIRAERRERAASLDALDPFEWVSKQVSAGLPKPLRAVEVARVAQDANAVELLTNDNRRVVVSTLSRGELTLFDRRARAAKRGKKKSAQERVASYAAKPLLGKNRWSVDAVVERVLSQFNEFFDMEATEAGKKMGVAWNNPTRLWFYVVD